MNINIRSVTGGYIVELSQTFKLAKKDHDGKRKITGYKEPEEIVCTTLLDVLNEVAKASGELPDGASVILHGVEK